MIQVIADNSTDLAVMVDGKAVATFALMNGHIRICKRVGKSWKKEGVLGKTMKEVRELAYAYAAFSA